MPEKSILRKEGFAGPTVYHGREIMEQEMETAGHFAPIVRKQRLLVFFPFCD